MADADQFNLTTLTVDLLSAYVTNNSVQHSELAELIKSTHAALKVIDASEPVAPEEPEHKPAVTLRKSLASASHIISMIDGKPYQTLKRHLSKHGLTPEQYRERFSLPKTYPMVAPAYSESRRAIAEKLGLGRRVKGAQDAAPVPAETPSDAVATASAVPEKPKKAVAPKASKAPAAKAEKIEPAPKTEKAPRKAKAVPSPAPIEAAATTAAKAPAGARKVGTPKNASAPAPVSETLAPAKPAPRKRLAKAAESVA